MTYERTELSLEGLRLVEPLCLALDDLRLVLYDLCPEGAHDDVQLFNDSIAVLHDLRLGLVKPDQRDPLVSLLDTRQQDGAAGLLDAGTERRER